MYVTTPRYRAHTLEITLSLFIMFLFMMVMSTQSYGQWPCITPSLNTNQIRNLIAQARETYSNLPRLSSNYSWAIEKVGCHYVYSESIPGEYGTELLQFTLNPFGVLVDFSSTSLH